MTKLYDNKSAHNYNFLSALNNDYPDEYFDWKVTAQFYCALHKTYCVLTANSIVIESRHSLNIKSLKGVNEDLSKKLFRLFMNSKQSRYEGFLSEENMERINRMNYNQGVGLLKSLMKECEKHYSLAS